MGAFDTNALQLDPDFVGRLTSSLPVTRPSGLLVHVARRPSAPFCETPIYCARIRQPSCKASELAKQRIVDTLHRIMANTTYPTLSISKAQSGLPKLCRDKTAILITTHEKPVSVLLPIEDYEALIETMDLLANPTAMRTLRAAKAGKLKYRRLNLGDENFGL